MDSRELLQKLHDRRDEVCVRWQLSLNKMKECGKRYTELDNEVRELFKLMGKIDAAIEVVSVTTNEEVVEEI